MADNKVRSHRHHQVSKFVLFVAMFLFTLMTGLIDFLTHGEIGFSVLYIIYISICSWMLRVGLTTFLILLSSILRIVVMTKYGQLSSEELVTYVNWTLNTGVMFVIALGISYFRKSIDAQKQYLRKDSITNLGNAQHLREVLSSELSRSKRYSEPFSIVIARSDSYSILSKKYSEDQAKSILGKFAKVFASSLRETDSCCFINEDSFIIVLAEADSKGAMAVLERLEQRLHRLYAQQIKLIHECLLKTLTFEALPLSVDVAIEQIEKVNETNVGDRTLVQWTYKSEDKENFILSEI